MLVITKCAHGRALLPEQDFETVVDAEVAQSLRDLGAETIDLLFLHRDNPVVGVDRIMEKLAEVMSSGRARAVGASNWSYRRIDSANSAATRSGQAPFDAVSNSLSLGRPAEPFYPNLVSADADGEAWHRTTGIPLIPWSSQARGFFTARWPAELRDSPEGSHDAFTARMLAVYGTDANYERLRRAQHLGHGKGGYTATQVALAWVLARPFPVAPIVGPRTLEELDSCVAALSLDLSPTESSWLDLQSPET